MTLLAVTHRGPLPARRAAYRDRSAPTSATGTCSWRSPGPRWRSSATWAAIRCAAAARASATGTTARRVSAVAARAAALAADRWRSASCPPPARSPTATRPATCCSARRCSCRTARSRRALQGRLYALTAAAAAQRLPGAGRADRRPHRPRCRSRAVRPPAAVRALSLLGDRRAGHRAGARRDAGRASAWPGPARRLPARAELAGLAIGPGADGLATAALAAVAAPGRGRRPSAPGRRALRVAERRRWRERRHGPPRARRPIAVMAAARRGWRSAAAWRARAARRRARA